MHKWLVIVGALALFSGAAHAEQLFCASQLVEKLPPDEWRFGYNGLLRSVTVIRYHEADAPASVVICRREYGAVMRSTSKGCRLAAGDGHVIASMQDKSKERFDCVFPDRSYADTNDQTCQVICE